MVRFGATAEQPIDRNTQADHRQAETRIPSP